VDRTKAGDVGGPPMGELAAGCSRGDGGVCARAGDVPGVESGRGGSRGVHRALTQQGDRRRALVARLLARSAAQCCAVRAGTHGSGPGAARTWARGGLGADLGARRPGAGRRRGRRWAARLPGASPAGVASSGGRPGLAWTRGRERRLWLLAARRAARLGAGRAARRWGRGGRKRAGGWRRGRRPREGGGRRRWLCGGRRRRLQWRENPLAAVAARGEEEKTKPS
jgi:hypothetical protein